MPTACHNGRCHSPTWMKGALLAAGLYHLLLAGWVGMPGGRALAWLDLPAPWMAFGLACPLGGLAVAFFLAAGNPIQHLKIVLAGWLTSTLVLFVFGYRLYQQQALPPAWMILTMGVCWGALAIILWFCVRVRVGIPFARSESYTVAEAADLYRLSTGETLAEASESRLLVLVFLRHFGCTFTRRILRGLEEIELAARDRGAELVLVHMLQSGKESEYLGHEKGVTRIADPRCELYRAFGLGKGGFIELFGPQVWIRGTASIIQGCGVGHLAGDGLQMPGAFLFRNSAILSAQPAQSAADLPDIPELFKQLPAGAMRDTLPA